MTIELDISKYPEWLRRMEWLREMERKGMIVRKDNDESQLIRKLRELIRRKGKLPRCELTECLIMNFRYFDPNEPTILRSIELACKDLGISMKYDENVLALVNALKGGKVDWEDAWLFVGNSELLGRLEVALGMLRVPHIVSRRKVTIDGKEYWLVRLSSKRGELLDRIIKLKWPRVLADDGITTGFIVEDVNVEVSRTGQKRFCRF